MSCTPRDDALLEACGCCEGVEPSTPVEIANRPGLPVIAYRIGAYGEFRNSMLAGLSSSGFAALDRLRTRERDDFTIGLIDAVACAADVLTFYQERIANESYLRTATERVSLQELGKLVGYRLRPGIAAEAWLAFALEAPKKPPPDVTPEPGAFVTGIPESVTLDKGLKVQSVPGQDEKPQLFETVETIVARPEWSAMPALPDDEVVPANGAKDTWLDGVETKLKVGDVIAFVHADFAADSTSDRWDLRVVAQVVAHPEISRTYVRWAVPLAGVGPGPLPPGSVFIHALRQRAAIFGHNAPDWPGLADQYKAGYLGLESVEQLTQEQRKEWPGFNIFGPGNDGAITVRARISAREAAEILKADLRANATAVARQGLASLGGLAAAIGSFLDKALSIPAKAAKGVLALAEKGPAALAQIAETLMAPIKFLVESAIGSLNTYVGGLRNSLGSVVGTVNSILTFLGGTGNLGTPGAPPGFPPTPPATTPIYGGDPLGELWAALDGSLGDLVSDLLELTRAGEGLRDAMAAIIEAALANIATATYTPLMEARISLSAKLPFATAESVCDEAVEASAAMLGPVPDFVVASALSDPRPGALLLVTLAPLDDGFAVNSNMGELRNRLVSDVTELSRAVNALLRNADPTSLVKAGESVGSELLSNVAGPFGKALLRMRTAAGLGLRRAHASLLERVDEILEGKPAREFPGRATDVVSLDRVYQGVVAPGYAALQTPYDTQLYEVTRVAEASRAEFAVSSKSTLLTVDGKNLLLFADSPRETTAFVDSQALELARTPITADISGATIDVTGSMPAPGPGRRIILRGARTQDGQPVAHHATLVASTVLADRTRLEFSPPLVAPLLRRGAVVFGNVALATHGETVSEILGSGDASRPFQRFELKRLPLTYRASPNESGVDSELTVRVGDVEWQERASLFGTQPDDRAYVVRTDEQGRDWVVFGDGERGARPVTGVNNVRAVYRQGLGRAGNVPAERVTQPMTRPMGLKSVSNPAKAEGGADPQPAEHARRSIPLGSRTLGRAVSLRDYEDFALAFAGIAKAQARLLALPSGPTIAITVAGQDGDAVSPDGPVWRNLRNAFRDSGDPHVSVVLLTFQRSVFRLGLKVRRDPAYAIEPLLAEVDKALRERFSFERRELGQPVMQSEVVAVAHTVPGVAAIDLDLLYGGTLPAAQLLPSLQARLLASAMRVENGVAMPAELLTLSDGPFDRLEEM